MKHTSVITLLLMSVQVYAQAKWINIESANTTPKEQKNIQNISSQPIKNIVKNVKIIQSLLDKTGQNKKPDKQEKNWYIIKRIDNN